MMNPTRMLFGCVLACGLALGTAHAQEPQTTAATPDPTRAYSLAANVTRQVLPNGLTVLIKEQHETRTVSIDLVSRVGQAQEDGSDAGITNLVGRALQRRVTNGDGKADDNLVEMTGSVMRFNVTPDLTEVSVDTTADHYRPLFARTLQAYQTRQFKGEELDFVRNQLIHDLEGEQRVFTAIYDIFLENFYRYHPYRAPQEGNADAIRHLSLSNFNKFYDRYYVPNHTVLAVVGDVNSADVMAEASAELGKLPEVQETVKIVHWEPVGTEKELQLSAGSNLAWIFLGYPAPGVSSPDYAAMRVMHAMMGEGVSSRLWVDLREENGLAYELGSLYPVLEGPGHFLSYIITTPAQLRQARRGMFAEMDRLRKEDVGPHELEQARWKVIGAALLQQETTAGKASTLATSEAQGVGYHFPDQFIAAVRNVTTVDVRTVANRYLDKYTLIVARPPGAL
ncbi:MAG TPA: pitrilysin family protein [Candidatus Xenobia bacterium]|jgi:predicted Zn-dependent peptidase